MARHRISNVNVEQKGDLDALQSRHRLNIKMGEPSALAQNLRLLTLMRQLTAEQVCEGLKKLLIQEAEANRDEIWAETHDRKQREEATRKVQDIRKASVDPKWYRRLMSKGVSRSDERTRAQFHAIAKFFGIRFEDMWDEKLITFDFTDRIRPNTLPQGRFSANARKLLELLERGGGEYDYLTTLIDMLHKHAFASEPVGNIMGGAFVMPDED